MTDNTREAVRAILAADSTIPSTVKADALKLLAGNSNGDKPLPRIVKTGEAARLCGVTTRTLRRWGDTGIIEPVYAGKAACRIGYTRESIEKLLSGKAGEVDAARANERISIMLNKSRRAPSKQSKRRA